MKRLNRFLTFSFILAVLASCVKEEVVLEDVQYELTAKMEMDASTRTSLSGLQGDMYYPLWSAGDELAVFVDGDTNPSRFTLTSGEGKTKATFAGTKEGYDYYALYPFSDTVRMENGALHFTLPAVQEYTAGSFGPGSFPMIGTGSKGVLNFKNLCAVMRISIKGEAVIRSIRITAKDSNIFISGPASVSVLHNNEPIVDMLKGGSNSVILDCKDIESKKDSVTDFHIVIPAQTYTNGFKISIDAYTEIIEKDISTALNFQRSQLRHLKNMELKVQMDEQQLKLMKEREALVKIYDVLDGNNWCYKYDNSDIRNENWCSDKPVGQWEGITTNSKGYVTKIDLYGCNLTGSIPVEIGVFTELQNLCLANNNIVGTIPVEISNLSKLEYLLLFNNRLNGEIPEELMNLTKLKEFRISNNGLIGNIPSEIGKLKELEFLQLGGNELTGTIPEAICNLNKLERIQLAMNRLTGEIPLEIGNLSNLEELLLEENFLEGSIPESVIRLSNLKEMRLFTNYLSGEIPESFYYWQYWKGWWGFSLWQNKYEFANLKLPGPEGKITCFDGKIINLPDEYKRNKYTILFQWTSGKSPQYGEETTFILPQMKDIHDTYSNKGIRIIGWGNSYGDTKESALQYIESTGMEWDNFYYDAKNESAYFNDKIENTFGNIPYYPSYHITTVTIVDSTGRIAFSDVFDRRIYEKEGYLKELLENDFKSSGYYTSTDYTQDGTTVQLQKASEGNGINIVLMGDGYSDRQIADGSYKADMEYVYSNLFTKEPYKSYKHLFNVSYVNAVSATEGFEYGNTALSCGFGDGTYVYGNDNAVFQYAQKVVESSKIDETLVIVVLNSNNYAGTCFMYYPNSSGTDYGKGAAVAYFPKGESSETFAQLLHHEANGHGFAKLADEYAYEEYGAVPAEEVESTKNQQSLYGWWKNVDFTNDPAQVRWKKFLEDSRYAKEGLGVFEGGLTYWSGVWRPTENSIMRYNQGEFNAPSREAIYYRMHKLAYGADWKYDYEKFVEYDAVNYNAQAAPTTKLSPLRPKQQLHPPVVIKKSWREARN